jgi:hypothetical protein
MNLSCRQKLVQRENGNWGDKNLVDRPSSRLCLAIFVAVFVAGAAIPGASSAAPTTSSVLTNFVPFPVEDGVNHIADFTKDRREATIFKAWRDNTNGNGYNIYVVTLPRKHSQGANNSEGSDNTRGADYNIVGFPGSGSRPVQEMTYDEPASGQDWVSAIVFGRGTVNGAAHTLMLRATRLWEGSTTEPALTYFEIMQLKENSLGIGLTPEYFVPVAGFSSTVPYCNAYMALFREQKIPLPQTYTGKRSKDGC